jgi:pSer/pThr/pTyr-binding forkhead associated (FHA) protein
MADKSRLPILGLITVLTGPMKGRSFQIHKPLTLIGRDPAKNDVVINDPFVSLQQARLRWRNGSSIIECLR